MSFFFFLNILLIHPVVEVCTGLFFCSRFCPRNFDSPYPERILTLPAHSQKNFYLTCPFPKKFWPILLIINQRNTVWSHTHSKRNCDWSCPLHKEFWTIPPTLKIIINDLAPSIINSDQSYPLQCHAAQAIPLCLFLMHTSSHECFINMITLCTFQDLLERPLIG